MAESDFEPDCLQAGLSDLDGEVNRLKDDLSLAQSENEFLLNLLTDSSLKIHDLNQVLSALKIKISDLDYELSASRNKMQEVNDDNEDLRGELRKLRWDLLVKADTIKTLESQGLDANSEFARDDSILKVAVAVRMAFLGQHRLRMGYRTNLEIEETRLREASRQASRGQPVADAWLYQEGKRSDYSVYTTLYGISYMLMQELRQVSQVVEVCNCHCMLVANGKMTDQLKTLFKRFIEKVASYHCVEDLVAAFLHPVDDALDRSYRDFKVCFACPKKPKPKPSAGAVIGVRCELSGPYASRADGPRRFR